MPKRQKTLKRGNWIKNEKDQRLLVGMWGEYINWQQRRKKEGKWLVNQLKKYKCKKVLDSCVGDGCDAIFLIRKGFDVISNDIDEVFIQKALENAKKEKVKLKITNLDWRELNKEFPAQSFDAVLCTGNSLTCLFKRKNQIKALEQFYTILKKEGVLIIDERNYQYVLDNREKILKNNHHSINCLYYGKDVFVRVVEIQNDRIRYELCDKRDEGRVSWAIVDPFKRGELKKLLEEVGFGKIKQYSDYKPVKKVDAIFYTYICQK